MKVILVILSFFVVLFLFGCGSKYQTLSKDPPPLEIVEIAQGYIVDRVGDAFFEAHYTYLPEESQKQFTLWEHKVAFEFTAQIDTLATRHAIVIVNTNRTIGFSVGVPDCENHPIECEFPIDATKAVEIAEAAGLTLGDRPPTVSFVWLTGLETFAWQVFDNISDKTWECDRIFVDANDGATYESEWGSRK